MTSETQNKKEAIIAIAEAVLQLTGLLAAVADDKVNTIPYEGSWTAPQLVRHVTKSMSGMAKTMQMDAKTTDRNPGERIEELKTTFMDFSKKMKSPEFIVPEERTYEKQSTIDDLDETFSQFKLNANKANDRELMEGLPLGPITKLEIIYFTLFHTQRHLQQMERICDALESK